SPFVKVQSSGGIPHIEVRRDRGKSLRNTLASSALLLEAGLHFASFDFEFHFGLLCFLRLALNLCSHLFFSLLEVFRRWKPTHTETEWKSCVCQVRRQAKSRHPGHFDYSDFFCAVGRSLSRNTNRNPDQVSSTAQTLLSTRPAARPISR